jgi:hypothetical protein
MVSDHNSNGLGQQTASVASPTVVIEGAERSTPAAGKTVKNKSTLRIAIGVAVLGLSLLKLIFWVWLAPPSHPTVTYRPIAIPLQAGELSRSLPKCEVVFPAGQGALPGINCFKSGGNNSDVGNKTR